MTVWVLLRGLTRESRHWGDFVATLAGELGDARIVALDLPGNGHLHRLASPTRVEAMVVSCRQQLAALGIEPPYRLLGLSLGAMVAVAWAQAHRDEVSACVLINTSLRPFSPFYQRLRPASYPALLRLALPGVNDEAREAAILRLTSAGGGDAGAIVAAWSAWRRQCPVSAANALRQLLAAVRYRAAAQPPAARLLVLASAQDALVDAACSRRLALSWQCAFAEHPTAGHDLPLDDGLWVARRVSAWLAQSPPPLP